MAAFFWLGTWARTRNGRLRLRCVLNFSIVGTRGASGTLNVSAHKERGGKQSIKLFYLFVNVFVYMPESDFFGAGTGTGSFTIERKGESCELDIWELGLGDFV